jgi:hypothetical protein
MSPTTFEVPAFATGVWHLGLEAIAVAAVVAVFGVFAFVVVGAVVELRAGRTASGPYPATAEPAGEAEAPAQRVA